ncbi:MAG: class II fumarate hydratase [bacterium]
MPTRIETDSLGAVEVPADRYWGAQTQRALEHFAAQPPMPRALIHALGTCKRVAAEVNAALGELDRRLADAVVRAAAEVEQGRLDDHFPLGAWQSGSGTQTNMNVNEVVANRASVLLGGEAGRKEPVHPNDHVNRGQSSNDTLPTAMHLAALRTAQATLLPGLARLREVLADRSAAFADLVKVGRTHLMDAVPMTLGQEFGGYAAQVAQAEAGLRAALDGLHGIAQGGTAVGTGLNAHPSFAARFAAGLAEATGFPFRPAKNPFAAQGACDHLVRVSGELRGAAVALFKIAGDIRLLASGPRCGLGELVLPVNEPGSSIMPGKVNPTQCEALTMVCAQVLGNDAAVALGGMNGQLELNVFKPLIARNVLESMTMLGEGARRFADHAVAGLAADTGRLAELNGRNLMVATALVPLVGYDEAARIARAAHAEGITLREAALRSGKLDAEAFDRAVRPADQTGA